jgi:hypothetical protein
MGYLLIMMDRLGRDTKKTVRVNGLGNSKLPLVLGGR